MRMIKEGQKRFPIFERKDGSWAKNPPTREEAVTYNRPLYEPFPVERCTCGHTVMKFVDESVEGNYCCTIDPAVAEYNHLVLLREPMSAAEARVLNKNYYFVHKSCEICGGLCKRTLNGKCFFCTGNSPRQHALQSGLVWYMPTTPCNKCGKIAEKRVANGECRSCIEARPSEIKIEPIHRQWPDMVISRDDAKSADMKTYRTGKPCGKGHAGWRWVSTRGCLTCQGRD